MAISVDPSNTDARFILNTIESLMTFVVLSVASTNRELFSALNVIDGFTKHSKINLSFPKGFNLVRHVIPFLVPKCGFL